MSDLQECDSVCVEKAKEGKQVSDPIRLTLFIAAAIIIGAFLYDRWNGKGAW